MPTTCGIDQGTTTLSNFAQATSFAASCSTYRGTVEVASSYSGALPLPGLQNVLGSLSIKGVGALTTVVAPDLVNVTGGLYLDTLPAIATLEMPKLENVGGMGIQWSATGDDLQTADFSSLTEPGLFVATDTGLRDLDWVRVTDSYALQFYNNTYLTDVTLPTVVGGGVWFGGNGGAAGSNVALPNFYNGSVSCEGCSGLSLPEMVDCGWEGLVQVYGSSMESLELPVLKTCPFVNINSNPNLAQISAPVLSTIIIPARMADYITGLSVGDNPSLTGEVTFPALSTLTGASFNGSFSGVSMPALTNETRILVFNSTEDISATCAHFRSISGPNNIVKGPLTCTSDAATSKTHHTSAAVIGGAVAGSIVAVLVLIGGVWLALRLKKKRAVEGKSMRTGDESSEEVSMVREDMRKI